MNDTFKLLFDWPASYEYGEKSVGGKAWNLGRLNRYGFNVPEGFVLPIFVYEQFIIENDISSIINSVSSSITLENYNEEHNKKAIDEIQTAIKKADFSINLIDEIVHMLARKNLTNKALAVRSSATAEDSCNASFAGIHESCLNINGIEETLKAIKICFSSIWAQRAIVYRRKMKINDENVLPAVIIMELVDADASGVAFSCDPASGREDVCLVNANFGLGESVVNGIADPDTYLINRYTFQTEKKELGKKEILTRLNKGLGTQNVTQKNNSQWVLSQTQQVDLGLLVSRIYSALSASDKHQDIEWAIKAGVFYVLQARPVTVLPRYTSEVMGEQADIWSNSNFRDALPMALPAAQRDSTIYMVNQTILSSFKDLGVSNKSGLSIVKLNSGRLYFNTGLYQRLLYQYIGMSPEDFTMFSGGHQPNIDVPKGSPYSGITGLKRLLNALTYSRKISRHQKKQAYIYARVDQFVDEFSRADFRNLSDQKFLTILHSTDENLNSYMSEYMLLSAGVGPFGIAINQLKKEFGEEAIGIVNALSVGKGNQPSAKQVYDLMRLAEIAIEDKDAIVLLKSKTYSLDAFQQLPENSIFKKHFMQYLADFGHRAVYEVNISQPRWNEDPSYLLANIAANLEGAPYVSMEHHKNRQQKLYTEADKRLKSHVSIFKYWFVKNLIKNAIKGADTRETAKSYSVKLFGLTRKIYLEIGRRFYERGLINEVDDVFHCSRADVVQILLANWDGLALRALIDDRKTELTRLEHDTPPDVILGNEAIIKRAICIKGSQAFQGIGVSTGQADGVAKKVNNPMEGLTLSPGDIMIAPSTDPSWTPLFPNIAGIVLETGGYTSHGSIVAREYGIPAVVNIAGALTIINENQRLIVDGNNGSVVLK